MPIPSKTPTEYDSIRINTPECPCGDVSSLDGEIRVADEGDAGDGEADGGELGEGDAVAVLGGEDGRQDEGEQTGARR